MAPAKPEDQLQRLSETLFDRAVRLVRSRLFAQHRDEKDVLVLASALMSYFARHVPAQIDWNDPDSIWPSLSKVALKHCNKHNKRLQRGVWFKLTHLSLENLRLDDLPEDVLSALGPLKNQEYTCSDLSEELTKVLGPLPPLFRKQIIKQIISQAERRYGWTTIPIGVALGDDSGVGLDPPAPGLRPDAEVMFAELIDQFRAKLKDRERQIFDLALAQQSQASIAQTLGFSQTTISVELACIRKKLYAELDMSGAGVDANGPDETFRGGKPLTR